MTVPGFTVLSLLGVLCPYQRLQQVVEIPLDALAQHEAVMAWEFACGGKG
jgi:hypothetical protein